MLKHFFSTCLECILLVTKQIDKIAVWHSVIVQSKGNAILVMVAGKWNFVNVKRCYDGFVFSCVIISTMAID